MRTRSFVILLLLISTLAFSRAVIFTGNMTIEEPGRVLLPVFMQNDSLTAGIQFSLMDDQGVVTVDSVILSDRTNGFNVFNDNQTVILYHPGRMSVAGDSGKIADLLLNVDMEKLTGTDSLRFGGQVILADREGVRYMDVVQKSGSITRAVTAIQNDMANTPEKYALEQNYPNPFNPETTIRFSLEQDGLVMIRLYNIHGEQVKTLVQQYYDKGGYSIRFNGSVLASGIYFYKIDTQNFHAVRKMLLIK